MKRFMFTATTLLVVVMAGFLFRKNHLIPYSEAVARYSTEHSQFMEWRGVRLHYTDQGQGIPVILFHGYAGSFDNWTRLVEVLPKDQYRLIVPDLPGLGLSEFPDVPEQTDYQDLYADFARHLIDELELDSVYLVGNSLGGLLAWETAVRNPDKVRKLVLLNAAGYSVEDIGSFFIKFSQSEAFRLVAKKGAPKFVAREAARRCLGDKSLLDPARVEAFYGLLNKEGNLEAIARLGTSGQYPDSTRISEVHVPTLIVWGDKDGVIPVEHAYKFHRDIPGSQLVIYEGSGHVPMLENTLELSRDMQQFFARPGTVLRITKQ